MQQASPANKTDFTLPPLERIKSRKLIDLVFETGKSISQSPLRMIWLPIDFDIDHPVKICVSAPKRRMKRANQRNRMKRLMKESYRLNKADLIETCIKEKKGLAIMLIAQCNTPLTYTETEDKIILLLQRLKRMHATVAE